MDSADYLYIIAELAAVLTGFSGVIFAIDAGAKEGFSRYVLEALIRRGILVAGFALLPLLLLAFGFSESFCWSISSAFVASFYYYLAVFGIRRRMKHGGFISARAFYSRVGLGLAVAVAASYNVGTGRPDIYLLAITVMLGLNSMLLIDFVRMVLARDT